MPYYFIILTVPMLQKFYQKVSVPTNPSSSSVTTTSCAITCANRMNCETFTFDEYGVCVLYYNGDIPNNYGYYQQINVIEE